MATAKTISLKDFSKLFGKDEKFLRKNLKRVKDAVYDGALRSVKPLAEKSPVDTGLYASSWEVDKRGGKDPVEIVIGNTAPYAYTIEFGAPPHKPPVLAIQEWAARKLQKPINDPEVKRLTWGTVNKIKEKGQDPKYILTKGIEEIILPNIKKSFEKGPKNDKGIQGDTKPL